MHGHARTEAQTYVDVNAGTGDVRLPRTGRRSWVSARYGYGVSMFERPMYTGGMACGRRYEPREMRREADSHCLATHALTCARADV